MDFFEEVWHFCYSAPPLAKHTAGCFFDMLVFLLIVSFLKHLLKVDVIRGNQDKEEDENAGITAIDSRISVNLSSNISPDVSDISTDSSDDNGSYSEDFDEASDESVDGRSSSSFYDSNSSISDDSSFKNCSFNSNQVELALSDLTTTDSRDFTDRKLALPSSGELDGDDDSSLQDCIEVFGVDRDSSASGSHSYCSSVSVDSELSWYQNNFKSLADIRRREKKTRR